MPVIDFRCRPNTVEYLSAFSGSPATVPGKLGTSAAELGTVESWIRHLDALDIEKAVFVGRQCKGLHPYDVGNDYIAGVARRFPERVIGFAGIDPLQGMETVRAAERAVRELGLKGISIEPFSRGVAPNDRRIYPLYAKCAELGVPIVVTCGPLPFSGPSMALGDVGCVDDVATDLPELTLIVGHSGWPRVNEAIAIAFRHENVYLDTSLYVSMPGGEAFAQAANTIIPDRILFASSFPAVPIGAAIESLRKMPFTPTALEGVLHGNARKLLDRLGIQ